MAKLEKGIVFNSNNAIDYAEGGVVKMVIDDFWLTSIKRFFR